MKHMKDKVAEFRAETTLNFSLARTPAESMRIPTRPDRPEKIQKHSSIQWRRRHSILHKQLPHKTLGRHPPMERLTMEGSFHPLTDGGAMSHVFLSEANPATEGYMSLQRG